VASSQRREMKKKNGILRLNRERMGADTMTETKERMRGDSKKERTQHKKAAEGQMRRLQPVKLPG